VLNVIIFNYDCAPGAVHLPACQALQGSSSLSLLPEAGFKMGIGLLSSGYQVSFNSLLCGILEKPLTKSSYTLAHLTHSFKAVLSIKEAGLALAKPYTVVPLCTPHPASLS